MGTKICKKKGEQKRDSGKQGGERLELKREERMKDKINGLKDNFKEIISLFFELMLKL